MITNVDPVASGFVDSLARPGGNITGLSRLTRELGGKRLELLKEVVPKLTRVAVLRAADGEGSASAFKEYQAAASVLKTAIDSAEVRGPNPDFDAAFQDMAKAGANALIMIRGPIVRRHLTQIANLAIKHRLACMCEGSDSVEAGGLMSYSTNDTESFRRAATYVDKILKGTKPADLPVEQPTKFEFVINLNTAKALNLTIPQSVLYRADKVIR
jgi:putative ABC transport system substrate-binding protein